MTLRKDAKRSPTPVIESVVEILPNPLTDSFVRAIRNMRRHKPARLERWNDVDLEVSSGASSGQDILSSHHHPLTPSTSCDFTNAFPCVIGRTPEDAARNGRQRDDDLSRGRNRSQRTST